MQSNEGHGGTLSAEREREDKGTHRDDGRSVTERKVKKRCCLPLPKAYILDKIHTPGLISRTSESEFLEVGPRDLHLKKCPLSGKVCFERHQKRKVH